MSWPNIHGSELHGTTTDEQDEMDMTEDHINVEVYAVSYTFW